MDYALDLKNFHAESSHSTLVPILVATEAPDKPFSVRVSEDGVSEVLLANARTLATCITTPLTWAQALLSIQISGSMAHTALPQLLLRPARR